MHLALNFQRVDPARGGAETYVALLCRHLVEAGHQVELYAERWADRCLPPEVNPVRVAAAGRTRLERIWSFAINSEAALRESSHDCTIGFINTYGHDVIIPQGGIQAGSLRGNAERFPAQALRHLYMLTRSASPRSWLYRAIERRQYDRQRQAVVVAPSNMVKRHIKEVYRVLPRQIHVVPNAIDLEQLSVSQPGAVRCAFRNRVGLSPGDLAGLFVGHNFALKGLRPLLLALAARRNRNRGARPIHLLVCGNGKEGPYRRLAERLGLGEEVRFLGFYPDIRSCYYSSDFFVQPTYYDPCSLVVLEALACGLPVITTAQNGASELLTSGREGYVLTSPSARSELVDALDRMTRNEQRESFSAAARLLGQKQSFESHVARLLSIFEQAAAHRAARRPGVLRHGMTRHAPHFDHAQKARL
jgi:UDP-glucose:(heptosyl)LPS alpha-1,3-glucosyltransferase